MRENHNGVFNTSKCTLLAALALASVLTFSCSSGDKKDDDPFYPQEDSSSSTENVGKQKSSSSQDGTSSQSGESSSSQEGTSSPSGSSSSVDGTSSSSQEEASSSSESLTGTVTNDPRIQERPGVVPPTPDNPQGIGFDTMPGNPPANMFTYKTVKIGEQWWMAENLKSDAASSSHPRIKCYSNDTEFCDKYGALFSWSQAIGEGASCDNPETEFATYCENKSKEKNLRGVCPAGWHIPSVEDWNKLLQFVDEDNGSTGTSNEDGTYSSEIAAKYLKATNSWNDDGNGTDDYGFAVLPGGFYVTSGTVFVQKGNLAEFVTSTQSSNTYAFTVMVGINNTMGYASTSKAELKSVRCVKN